MTSHTNAGYKQYYDRHADQELKLGGEGEVSLQLDLDCNKVQEAQREENSNLGKAWKFGLYIH